MDTQLSLETKEKTKTHPKKRTLVCFTIFAFCFFSSLSFSASQSNNKLNTDLSETLKEGMAFFEKGEYLKAKSIFSAEAEQNLSDAKALQLLGMSQYKLQDSKNAIQSLEKSLVINPKNAESHYALGISYLARTGYVSILKVRKMLKKAVLHLEKSIEINPKHTSANFYLIQVLINAPGIMGGNEDRGLELNSRLAEIGPLQHMVVNSTIAIKNEEYDRAEKILLNADKQFPNKTMIAYSLGELYLRLENYPQALDYGKKFLSGPKLWDETSENSGYYLLARAYKGLDNKPESQKYYDLVLENTKSKRMKKQIKRELDELDGKIIAPDKSNEENEFTEEQLNDPDFIRSLSEEPA
ncbi:MAG: tetratricopeptide repeat protein [Cellvibrionaceae bacterium]